MSRAVRYDDFGGPDVLAVSQVAEPHAGPGQVRVRVAAAGLNPMDWMLSSDAELAERFGVAVPAGFGSDFAGTVDEVADDVSGIAVGDRVFGTVIGAAVADFVVTSVGRSLWRTPDGISDTVASALPVPGLTALAALGAIGLHGGDTVLIGAAAGGVGVLAVQLARLAGATVIGTAAPSTFDFVRDLGALPVAYGAGLVERVRALSSEAITAAADLFGTETAEAALQLGVPPARISTVAAGPHPPGGVQATGGAAADPQDMRRITDAILAGDLIVPIAGTYPMTAIREAVTEQARRHVHGKIVVTP